MHWVTIVLSSRKPLSAPLGCSLRELQHCKVARTLMKVFYCSFIESAPTFPMVCWCGALKTGTNWTELLGYDRKQVLHSMICNIYKKQEPFLRISQSLWTLGTHYSLSFRLCWQDGGSVVPEGEQVGLDCLFLMFLSFRWTLTCLFMIRSDSVCVWGALCVV